MKKTILLAGLASLMLATTAMAQSSPAQQKPAKNTPAPNPKKGKAADTAKSTLKPAPAETQKSVKKKKG